MIGLHKAGFADNRHLPYQLDVREARRKPGSIGMSSHFIDFVPGQPERCERLNGPPEF
jgi:hypothetical protein